MPTKAPVHNARRLLPNRAREERGSAAARGYDRWWQRESKRFLQQHPLCKHCTAEERTTAAVEVDHIIPHRGNMKLFRDRRNWQSLCKSHHSRKTRRGE